MAEKGVHYLAHATIEERLARNAEEIAHVSEQLQEAIKMGDLRENAEYDAAKEAMGKATRERDMLLPVLDMPTVRSSDSVAVFEEGCVVDIQVYHSLREPVEPNSEAFKKIVSDTTPAFEGRVMLGGTLPIQELLVDAALDVATPVGSYLLGKPSGSFIVKVPGGFVPVVAKKLKTTEFTPEEVGCTYNG